ncbi:MAG: DUF853 family protein [Micavibrio aeruginosavorus]|nr:DUF853 family protein [Micavibrio aeruginosavorus]
MATDRITIGAITGHTEQKIDLLLKYANRHGLIAGATGTGKTVTLQGLAEGFSAAGVPVFLADVKGDLSGLAQPGAMQDFLVRRAQDIGLEGYAPQAFPAVFWDLYGEKGHPLRTTLAQMGPLLLSRMLGLNETQEGVVTIAYRVAAAEALPLLDLKDMQSLLAMLSERAGELSARYGNIAAASVGAIQRKLLTLEDQGGAHFFGEPSLDLNDFMRGSADGRGNINILAADRLMQAPKLYATFLFWMLSELFEVMPESGDAEKPKLVFFFDEAHLLFGDAPKPLLEKIEQVVRLIRSKGVGVYFITQDPGDVPDSVSAQLGNRIIHNLRAYTPQTQKSVKAAAQTFRPNPDLDIEAAITALSTGEAIVSLLEDKGIPGMAQRVLIRPPASLLGPASEDTRRQIMAASLFGRLYGQTIDRESAHEILSKRMAARPAGEAAAKPEKRGSTRQGYGETLMKSMLRQAGNAVVREVIRSVKNGLKGGR